MTQRIMHSVNPPCGDDYHLFVKIEDEKSKILDFMGVVVISKSVSSMMTIHVMNKTVKTY